ncbi:MAG: ABC transporter ATP-binding protein/permease [Spirochaetaceae bacterium]|jgi:ATP-binding cassette subfamily B protein|nr:ABC transporter ATP-binding protein/permease [Spirochaetaceae bacterium]
MALTGGREAGHKMTGQIDKREAGSWKHIVWAWQNMGPRRPLMVAGLLLAALTSVMLLVNPMLAAHLIDDVIIPQNTAPLLPLLGLLFAVQFSRLVLRYVMIVLMEINSTSALTSMRRHLYNALQNAGQSFLRRFPTGNLMTRMTSDLERTRHSIAWVTYQLVDAVTIFASAIVFLLFVNWRLALMLAAVTPFILIISKVFVARIRARFVLLREKLTQLSTTVSENIDGNRVVKAFAREPYEIAQFERHNAAFRDTSVENALIAARYQPALEVFSQVLAVITLAAGGVFLIRGEMTPGAYLAFSSYTWALANPLRMLGMLLSDLQAYHAAAAMVEEVYDGGGAIVDRPDAAATAGADSAASVEFRRVCYRSGGMEILADISFSVKAGATLGILGTTGAGKTSLVNLLLRFIEPDSGEVLFDGKPVNAWRLSSLRSRIGLAMQDVFLFSDTVRANIAYGVKGPGAERIETGALDTAATTLTADMADIARWAETADAAGFIEGLSEGYETLVGERGVGLSGGQKQRLSLARALAIRPALLILDDTTSAVDSETERHIQERLLSLDTPCTKIIIAQRLSSFRGASEILVMDRGRIVERGAHDDLLAAHGFYRSIWDIQNGGAPDMA